MQKVQLQETIETLNKDELQNKLKKLFIVDGSSFVQSEATDKAELNFFSDKFEITPLLFRVRVFSDKCEVIAEKNNDSYFVRTLREDTNEGKEYYSRKQSYILRDSEHNICKTNRLSCKEYYEVDEDGLLKFFTNRFCALFEEK